MKKKIALIAGGDSSEWKIALEGAALIEQVLDTDKYDVYKIVLHDGRWTYTAPDGATTELDRNDSVSYTHLRSPRDLSTSRMPSSA